MSELPANFDEWKTADPRGDVPDPVVPNFDDIDDMAQHRAVVGWAEDEAWELAELIDDLVACPAALARLNHPVRTNVFRLAKELAEWKEAACEEAAEQP